MKKQVKKVTKTNNKSSNQSITLVRKANELVEARYKFDIWEMRIFLEMLAKIRSEDSDFMDYKIYLKDFVKDFFLQDNKNTYRLVKDAAKKLMGKLIEAKINRGDGKMEDFISPVVTSFKGRDQDNEEASYIKLSFHPDMRPFLLELKERYLTYEFRNVANLSSSYYVRIYELLKQYEKIGKRKMSVEGLKAMLGIETEYKSYGHFKDKILEKSKINLLKYTDIRFEYEEITNGTRKVIDLMFYISRNVPEHRPEVKIERNFVHRPTVEVIQPQLFDPKLVIEKAEIVEESTKLTASWLDTHVDLLRKKWNVSPSSFILKAQGKSEEDVKRAIDFTEERIALGKAVNPAGIFLDCLEKGYISGREQKNLTAAQKNAEISFKKRKLQELETLKSDLMSEYDMQSNDIVRDIVQQDPSVTERAIEEIKLMYTHLQGKTLEEFRRSPMLRGIVIGKMKTMFPERFDFLAHYEDDIRKIGMEMELLKK
jgi:plasmid replication initiation protein